MPKVLTSDYEFIQANFQWLAFFRRDSQADNSEANILNLIRWAIRKLVAPNSILFDEHDQFQVNRMMIVAGCTSLQAAFDFILITTNASESDD